MSTAPRKLLSRHRYLLDLLCDAGISQYTFRQAIGLGKHSVNRLLCDTSYVVAQEIHERIVNYLVSLEYPRDLAEQWAEWTEPGSAGRPRVAFIMKEIGLSMRQAAEHLGTQVKENFNNWLNRTVEVHGEKPIVQSIATHLIPWMKKRYPSADLSGWFIRITPQQRIKEILSKEAHVRLEREGRKKLGLRQDPFAAIPCRLEHFYFTEGIAAVVGSLIDAVEQGLITAYVGSRGSGKSTIRRILELNLEAEDGLTAIRSGLVVTKRFHAGQILDDILEQLLNIDSNTRLSINEKVKRIYNELIRKACEGRRYCLVVDEADKMIEDNLRSLKQLNELEFDGRRLLPVVLFGQDELFTLLNSAHLEEVSNRTSCYVAETLGPNLVPYLKHRLVQVSTAKHIETLILPGAWQALEDFVKQNFEESIYYLDAHKLMILILRRAVETGDYRDGIGAETVYGALGFSGPVQEQAATPIASRKAASQ